MVEPDTIRLLRECDAGIKMAYLPLRTWWIVWRTSASTAA